MKTEIIAQKNAAKFLLTYGLLLVGILTRPDLDWLFEYSNDFKQQENLRAIVQFPDLEKTYRSRELWQFFASRIPSTERPEIKELIDREKIDENDTVALLKRFAVRVIANPFFLKYEEIADQH